jgi:undecaprenyl-diphosphatase
MNWIESLLLGVVQGLTEFLPISSDGHLGLVQLLFDRISGRPKPQADGLFFIVILHLGTLAAILVHYRRQAHSGVRGLMGATDVPEPYRRTAVIRTGILVFAATLLLIPVKFVLPWIEASFENPYVIGVGFWITAGVLMVTSSVLAGGDKGPAETTLVDALLIGTAQMFAPLPGVSRSGLTIAAALAVGFRRTWAVQFSLMLAVPAILGANLLELKDAKPMPTDRIAQAAVATVIAGFVGYVAIVWLVRVVHAGKLWYFSVYLFALGLAMIVGFAMLGGPRDARPAPPAHGAARADSPRPPDRRISPIGQGALDRPVRSIAETGRV